MNFKTTTEIVNALNAARPEAGDIFRVSIHSLIAKEARLRTTGPKTEAKLEKNAIAVEDEVVERLNSIISSGDLTPDPFLLLADHTYSVLLGAAIILKKWVNYEA